MCPGHPTRTGRYIMPQKPGCVWQGADYSSRQDFRAVKLLRPTHRVPCVRMSIHWCWASCNCTATPQSDHHHAFKPFNRKYSLEPGSSFAIFTMILSVLWIICCFCSVGVGILLSVIDKIAARDNNVMSYRYIYPSKLANCIPKSCTLMFFSLQLRLL